jgi:hypothetical protein
MVSQVPSDTTHSLYMQLQYELLQCSAGLIEVLVLMAQAHWDLILIEAEPEVLLWPEHSSGADVSDRASMAGRAGTHYQASGWVR